TYIPLNGISLPDTSKREASLGNIRVSFSLQDTIVFGLEHSKLADDVKVTTVENGQSAYDVHLRLDNVTLSTLVHCDVNLGTIEYDMPFEANITIGHIPISFTLTMTGSKISLWN